MVEDYNLRYEICDTCLRENALKQRREGNTLEQNRNSWFSVLSNM